MALELLTQADLARGRIEQAETWSLRAEATASGLGLGVPVAQAARARAAVLAASGEPEGAAQAALAAVDAVDVCGARLESARSRLLAGRLLAATGERRRAVVELSHAHSELAVCGAQRFRDQAAGELQRLVDRTSWQLP